MPLEKYRHPWHSRAGIIHGVAKVNMFKFVTFARIDDLSCEQWASLLFSLFSFFHAMSLYWGNEIRCVLLQNTLIDFNGHHFHISLFSFFRCQVIVASLSFHVFFFKIVLWILALGLQKLKLKSHLLGWKFSNREASFIVNVIVQDVILRSDIL